MKKPGYIVETKSGKIGRTYHSKGLINGKIAVYLGKDVKQKILPSGDVFHYCDTYEDKAILCEPSTLKHIGFID